MIKFYFHTSLWYRKRFYEVIKLFEPPQKSTKKKINLIFVSIQLSEMHGTGRVTNMQDFSISWDITDSNAIY